MLQQMFIMNKILFKIYIINYVIINKIIKIIFNILQTI